jgi:hypothetical protein
MLSMANDIDGAGQQTRRLLKIPSKLLSELQICNACDIVVCAFVPEKPNELTKPHDC